MKKEVSFLAALLLLAACEKTPAVSDGEPLPLRIVPVMTKAGETDFDAGDAIGVSILRAGVPYVTNEKLSYDGSVFAGDLCWYAEGGETAVLKAYYPYSATVPERFSVQADQREGTSASDFIAGSRDDVLPSAHAVTLPFRHRLSRIVLNLTNRADGEVAGVSLTGARLTALVDADFSATADEAAPAGTVQLYRKSAETYVGILPPQTVSLTVTVQTAGGKELSQALAEATLGAGKQYTVSVTVNPEDLQLTLSGDIDAWEDGGELGADESLTEHLSEGYILYHEDRYSVKKMADGKWWMTQNLRYVPEGLTPCSDLNDVTAGVYCPLRVNGSKTAAEFSGSADVVEANGYLYQAEVALGLNVGDLTAVAEAEALEGTQGICPAGWHVPTVDDIVGLVGKAVAPIVTVPTAPYYDGANGSVALLNADGFNMAACGAVSITDNTKTSGTFMGFLASYPDRLTSGMFCGSTYAGVTYNTANDEGSGVKNLQFYGFMPMTNKAEEADYTCNGTKVSYRIAAPLRCVRN